MPRDHAEDARTIARDYLDDLRCTGPVTMSEILDANLDDDADLDDDDVEAITAALNALADRLEATIDQEGPDHA